MSLSGAIIPHAGKTYAGDCRHTAFKRFDRNAECIIYIAAMHFHRDSRDKVYVLNDDGIIDNKDTSRFEYELPPNMAKEHSYKWVEEELRQQFPNAKILALSPTKSTKWLIDWIIAILKTKRCLLFATTDLSHFGQQYGTANMYGYPQQMAKIKREEGLIAGLVENRLMATDRAIMCGYVAIHLFISVSKRMKWAGEVTDYYDSSGIRKKHFIDRYMVDYRPVKSFVSYVSIVYGANISTEVTEIDINTAIGFVKSVVARDTVKAKYQLSLPKWNRLHKRKHGIFVGTEIQVNGKYKTNCSYGRFEATPSRSSKKVIDASGNCYNDAKGRWRIPYSIANLDKMRYKVELLEPEREWRKYPAKDAKKWFKMDGKHGVHLRIRNGSATYLPVVAAENQHWTVEEYMSHLSKKAGGLPQDWQKPTSIMRIYRTISYKLGPDK